MRHSRRLLASAVAIALLGAAPGAPLGGAEPAAADTPTLFAPTRTDTVDISEPPAPLLVPGRPQPGAGPRKTREQAAREAFDLGYSFESQNAPAAAISSYRNAVKFDSTIAQAHFRMGMLFAAVGQHRAAIEEFAAEITHHPGDRAAARMLGLALAQDGDTARAIQQLERLTRLDAKDAASWRALGFAYSVAERPAQGERAFRRALAVTPKDGPTWRDLGALYAATHRDDDARMAYRKAAEFDAKDSGALVNLGNLERRARRVEPALAAYREAERRDTTLSLAYRGQTQTLIEAHRDSEAGAVYRRWLAAHPDETSVRVEAIQLFQRLGRNDIALEIARDGIRRDPRSGEARLAFGMALHAMGEERDALLELRRAESWLQKPEQRLRVAALIRGMREHAPDSLRAIFAEDSTRFEGATRDTAR